MDLSDPKLAEKYMEGLATPPTPPKHRHELKLAIGAHTLEELQSALTNIVIELRESGNISVSGSPSWAGHLEHVVDVTQTREKYVEQLESYLNEIHPKTQVTP